MISDSEKFQNLPKLQCAYHEFGSILANSEAEDWKKIAPILLVETVSGKAPKQPTWFKIGWNSHKLRVLFHAHDLDAWATMTGHDDPLYDEEVVEVFFDPVGDLESYFEIEVNPLNAICDLVLRRTRNGYRKDFAWHCENIETAVVKTETAWTAELSIPFASLGSIVPQKGMQWRGNFFRIDRPKNADWELSAWSPTARPAFHVQERFGVIEFV